MRMKQDDGMSKFLDAFLAEMDEMLQSLSQHILALEKNPDDKAVLQELFRCAHTLKGSSGAMGFTKVGELTHAMENVLDRLRNGEMRAGSEITDLLFACLDLLQDIRGEIAAGSDTETDISAAVSALRDIHVGRSADTAARSEPADYLAPPGLDEQAINDLEASGQKVYLVTVEMEDDCSMKSARAFIVLNNLKSLGEVLHVTPDLEGWEADAAGQNLQVAVATTRNADELRIAAETVSEIKQATAVPYASGRQSITTSEANGEKPGPGIEAVKAGAASPGRTIVNKTVRVNVSSLDNLLNLVGELVIERIRLSRIGETFAGKYEADELTRDLNDAVVQLSKISDDLQEEIMKARMLPIKHVFNRFPRMMRDLARETGKDIDFVVEGEETELDRSVVEEIVDPLLHLLRNSVDHGIELPEERVRQGKEHRGTVRLSAFHAENHIIITVEDDGRGLDCGSIKAKAVLKGLISPDQCKTLAEAEVVELLFSPGFSMAEKVTDISGRGVGLDVVKTNLEKLNGVINVENHPGIGTKFTVKLPLTLAIMQALLIGAAERVYAVPLLAIAEIIAVEPQAVKTVSGREVILLRDKVLPLTQLAGIFGYPSEPLRQRKKLYVVVVGSGDRQIGLIIDRLIGEEEMVIKSLGSFFGQIEGIAGATILGDGSIALILDIPGLVRNITSGQ